MKRTATSTQKKEEINIGLVIKSFSEKMALAMCNDFKGRRNLTVENVTEAINRVKNEVLITELIGLSGGTPSAPKRRAPRKPAAKANTVISAPAIEEVAGGHTTEG